MSQTISVADFFSGLFSALEIKTGGTDGPYLCGNVFNQAIRDAFQVVEERAELAGLRTGFDIVLHPIYKDSGVINQGLSSAIRRDIISLDNPGFQKFRLKIEEEAAEGILDALPGSTEIYLSAADAFIARYHGKEN